MNTFGRHPTVLAVGLACLVLAGCDRFTSVETRMERAETSLAQGRVNAALSDAQVIAKKGGVPAVHLLLARISLKQGNAPAAMADLDRAAAAGVPAAQVQPLRVEALLAAGRHEDVVLSLQGNQTPEAKVQTTTALLGLGRREEAAEQLQPLLQGSPASPEAQLLQARIEAESGDRTAARTRLDAFVAANPELARGWVQRARLIRSGGDLKLAITSLEEARKFSVAQLTMPEQWSLLAELAELKLATNDIAGAAKDVEALKRDIPDALPTQILTARLLVAQKEIDAAVGILQKAQVSWPDNVQVRVLLGGALIEQGSREQARTHLSALLADHPDESGARRMLAQLLLSQGDAAEAGRVLDEQPESAERDAGIEWLRSVVLASAGRNADALQALERAAATDRSNVRLQLDLVRAYLASNRAEDARKAVQQIAPEQLGLAGRGLQVLTLALGLPPAQAKAAVQELATQNPKDAAAQVAVGQFLFQVGDTAAAAASFQQALAIDPTSPEPYLGLATVAFRNGDNAAAEAELQRMVKQKPQDERGYLSLAMLAVRQGKSPQAEQYLRQAISAIPEAQNSRLALAQLAAARKDAALVKAMLSQTITLAQNKLPVLLRAAMLEASMQDYPAAMAHVDAFRKGGGSEAQAEELRGTLLLAQKRVPEALVALEKSFKARPTGGVALKLFTARRDNRTPQPERVLVDWVRDHPTDLPVRLGLANFLLAEKDYPAAIQNYEAIARTSSGPALLNNLAWAYQQVGDRRAVATAKAAYEGSKQSPDIADTYGWILLRSGKAAEALPLLKLAAEGRPSDKEIQSHYADALEATGAAEQAAAVRARAKS